MDTLWSNVLNLYMVEGHRWGIGDALTDGGGCLCAGAAIAKAITNDTDELYSRNNPYVVAALDRFANHVNANPVVTYVHTSTAKRVYTWNDGLDISTGADTVFKALKALDVLARTECDHMVIDSRYPYLYLEPGRCLFCTREMI